MLGRDRRQRSASIAVFRFELVPLEFGCWLELRIREPLGRSLKNTRRERFHMGSFSSLDSLNFISSRRV